MKTIEVKAHFSPELLDYLNTISGKTTADKLRNLAKSHKVISETIEKIEYREKQMTNYLAANFNQIKDLKSINAHSVNEINKFITKIADYQVKVNSLTETVQQCHVVDANHVKMIKDYKNEISILKCGLATLAILTLISGIILIS